MRQRVYLRCALTGSGEVSVMISGLLAMLTQLVTNLASLVQVRKNYII